MVRFIFLLAVMVLMVTAAKAQTVQIGSTIENFSLSDVNGKSQNLNGLKGSKGTVIIFLSAQCPVVKGYNERIRKISDEYSAKGIAFVGINSNSTESLDWVKSNADENYSFPVLIDKGNVLADKLGANVTPEIFFLDSKNVLLYHGAIDNDRSGRNPTEHYLTAAFDASLAGKKIERTSANAFGCTIKRVGE